MPSSQKTIVVGDASTAQPLVPVGVGPGESVLITAQNGSTLNVLQQGIDGPATAVTVGNSLTVTQPVWLQSQGVTGVALQRTSTADPSWVTVRRAGPSANQSGAAQGTYLNQIVAGTALPLAGVSSGLAAEYYDPADFASGALIRLRAQIITNSVDPAVGAVTVGLAPITGTGGGSNLAPTITTIGSYVVSLTITPVVSSTAVATSAAVPFPPAGFYCFAYSWAAGTVAVNSDFRLATSLQVQKPS